jgi:hypothetical protein
MQGRAPQGVCIYRMFSQPEAQTETRVSKAKKER